MSSKLDFWEKLKIATSFLSGVVLVAIPIVIQAGASNIAQSLETGRVIQELTTDLTRPSEKTRRDIALVALNSAIQPEKQCRVLWMWGCRPNASETDQVVSIAVILLKEFQDESEQAKQVIRQRMLAEEADNLISRIVRPNAVSNPNPNIEVSREQADQTAQAAEIAANVLASSESQVTEPNFTNIRIVYVQYSSDVAKAEMIQKLLQEMGVNVPGLEQVNGIAENSIRYANSLDEDTANRLQALLVEGQGLSFVPAINLENSGYRVPNGQFEIWLKD